MAGGGSQALAGRRKLLPAADRRAARARGISSSYMEDEIPNPLR